MNWLHDFPIPGVTPDTWPLNDLFLKKLEQYLLRWKGSGYSWKFGLEHEFILFDQHDAEGKLLRSDSHTNPVRVDAPKRQLQKDYDTLLQNPPDPEIFQRTVDRLKDFLTKDPGRFTLAERNRYSLENMLAEVQQYEANFHHKNNLGTEARKNIYLAMLHTFPVSEGGLSDIIEPRWGSARLGIGWYDQMGPEVRTKISDPFTLIANYHQYLHTIGMSALQFGFIQPLKHVAPHIHYSVWRDADNKNMMLLQDEESTELAENVIGGYFHLLKNAPYLSNVFLPGDPFHRTTLSVGTSRRESIRQEYDNAEIRPSSFLVGGKGADDGVRHIALDLFLLVGGAAYAYLNKSKNHSGSMNDIQMTREEKPLVRHRFGNDLSAIKSSLEHSAIGKDGKLIPDKNILKANLGLMDSEIGKSDFHRIDPDDKDITEWLRVFSSLIVRADNTLDLSALDAQPEIKAALENFIITGRRTVPVARNILIDGALHTMKKTIDGSQHSDILADLLSPEELRHIQKFSRERLTRETEEAGSGLIDALAQNISRKTDLMLDLISLKLDDMPVHEFVDLEESEAASSALVISVPIANTNRVFGLRPKKIDPVEEAAKRKKNHDDIERRYDKSLKGFFRDEIVHDCTPKQPVKNLMFYIDQKKKSVRESDVLAIIPPPTRLSPGERSSFIASIRPHFQRAVKTEIADLRTIQSPNEGWMTALEKLARMLDNGLRDVETHIPGIVISYLDKPKELGPDEFYKQDWHLDSMLLERDIATWFQAAMEQPDITAGDLIAMAQDTYSCLDHFFIRLDRGYEKELEDPRFREYVLTLQQQMAMFCPALIATMKELEAKEAQPVTAAPSQKI